jgi:hypothetical protein
MIDIFFFFVAISSKYKILFFFFINKNQSSNKNISLFTIIHTLLNYFLAQFARLNKEEILVPFPSLG